MRAGATKVQSFKRRAILRPSNQRPERKKLIDCLFAVMNMPAAEPVSLLEIERRDYLACNNQIAQAGRVSLQLPDHLVRKFFTPRGPITLFQLIRRELHVNRHHMLACRRERRIADRWDVDIEIRLRRKLAILRSVKRSFEIINLRTYMDAAGEFRFRIASIYTIEGW